MDEYKVKIAVDYLGDLHCKVTHGLSGNSFMTDAPVDNKGKGEFISPTDLAGASIGSCVATIMGQLADTHNIDIKGMKIIVEKQMVNQPFRRIGKLLLDITFPNKLDEHQFKILSNVVKTCPVTRSLSSEVELEYFFHMPN
ncbi:MAG: redox protein [Ignavibacteria bacterium]|nr:redox protein [Ignavibacteria bacterium]